MEYYFKSCYREEYEKTSLNFIEWLRASLANATEALEGETQMVIVLDKIEKNKMYFSEKSF